jgi:hypothetical protein
LADRRRAVFLFADVRYWHLADITLAAGMSAFVGKADVLLLVPMSANDPKQTWVHRLSFGAGLMVLDTPHKITTDTAYQASVAESSVLLPPE